MGLQESLGRSRPHPYGTDVSPRFSGLAWRWQKESYSHPNYQLRCGLPTVKWQSPHATHSLPCHLNSPTEEATGNPSSPAQGTERNKESAFGSGFIKKPLANTDGKTGQCVLGEYFQKFHYLASSALRHKDTEPLWARNRTWSDPPFHQDKTSKSYSRSCALETWTPGSPPLAGAPSTTLWCCLETWNPSVCETPHCLQYSIRIETKNS